MEEKIKQLFNEYQTQEPDYFGEFEIKKITEYDDNEFFKDFCIEISSKKIKEIRVIKAQIMKRAEHQNMNEIENPFNSSFRVYTEKSGKKYYFLRNKKIEVEE